MAKFEYEAPKLDLSLIEENDIVVASDIELPGFDF